MSQSTNRNEPWRANERHYCAVCNSWMGSDRQSILIHENGKKHRENVELNLVSRREEKLRLEKDNDRLESSLKQMEKAAAEAMSRDIASGIGNVKSYHTSQFGAISDGEGVVTPNVPVASTPSAVNKKNVIESWEDRKKGREKTELTSGTDEKTEGGKKRQLGPDEGYYIVGETTYLEGTSFAPIFEEDMTVQIWTGSPSMTSDYKKSASGQALWKNCIILKVHKDRTVSSDKETEESALIKCHVSYLNNINDEDETIEKRVEASRLRLILGLDELTPATLDEARLSLLGGEEVTVVNDALKVEIDENTGLSGWAVSSVRKTTVNCELKQERSRVRIKKREEEEKEANKMKEAEGRRMEEAKHENADDSALGAYDVWSTSGRSGYKGVQINASARLDVSETAKSLSRGRTDIKFKKRGGNNKENSVFKKARKKRNIRTTFAEDD